MTVLFFHVSSPKIMAKYIRNRRMWSKVPIIFYRTDIVKDKLTIQTIKFKLLAMIFYFQILKTVFWLLRNEYDIKISFTCWHKAYNKNQTEEVETSIVWIWNCSSYSLGIDFLQGGAYSWPLKNTNMNIINRFQLFHFE